MDFLNEQADLKKNNSLWHLFSTKTLFLLPTVWRLTIFALSHHCWRQTLHSRGQLIRLLIFFSSLQSPCSTSLGCDVNVISFHMALQQANVTAESCSAFSLLSLQPFLSAACFSVLVWVGGLVKCIIYPCLPPWSGNRTHTHKKRALSMNSALHCQHGLKGLSHEVELLDFFLPWEPKYNNPT